MVPSLLSLLCAGLGVLLFACAMPVHARQMGWRPPAGRRRVALRLAGAAVLAASLWLAQAQDHATIAVLVWVMQLALAAALIALVLGIRYPQ